jgi:hypothetical protein
VFLIVKEGYYYGTLKLYNFFNFKIVDHPIEDDFDKIPIVDENKKLLGFLAHPDITRYHHQVVNQK